MDSKEIKKLITIAESKVAEALKPLLAIDALDNLSIYLEIQTLRKAGANFPVETVLTNVKISVEI